MAALFRRTWALAGAMIALGLSAGQARADFVVQVTSLLVAPAGPVTVGLSTTTVTSFIDNPSNLTLANTPSQATSQAFGATTISTTRAPGGGADTFNIPIEFQLTLSGVGGPGNPAQTATIDLKGTLSGRLGSNFDTLSFAPTSGLATPTASPATSTYTSVLVDGATVFVALTAYTPPGSPPGSTNDFAVYLYAAVPEPSTIALLGIGGVFLAAPRLRRLARRNVKI